MFYDVSSSLIQASSHDTLVINAVDKLIAEAYDVSHLGYISLSLVSPFIGQTKRTTKRILRKYVEEGICTELPQYICGQCSTLITGDLSDDCPQCGIGVENFYLSDDVCYRVLQQPDHSDDSLLDDDSLNNDTAIHAYLGSSIVNNIDTVSTINIFLQQDARNDKSLIDISRNTNKMIDPITATLLANTAITFLRPYFEKFAEGFAEHAGEKSAEAVAINLEKGKQTFEAIKQQLENKPEKLQHLVDFQSNPSNATAEDTLKQDIIQEIETNKDLLLSLSKITGINVHGNTTNINTHIAGNVEKSVSIGNIEGDANF